MGREIKRVPLDFDWPLDQTWSGYLMPDNLSVPDCGTCAGRGETTARQWVGQIAHLLMVLDDDLNAQTRGRDLHPWLRDTGCLAWGVRPSADIREFGTGLAGRESDGSLGHDGIDRWRATDALIRAAGLDPDVWGKCSTCDGTGSIEAYPGQAAEAEAWQRTDPPEGEGWQVWQTVGEGSPITPVLPTAEALVDHLATVGTLWDQKRGDGPWRRPAAESFVGSGWAPSFIGIGPALMEGGKDADLIDAATADGGAS
jgi:hypothetical protein